MSIVIESRVRWPHTGIEAPHAFTVRGYKDLETRCGVAFSAELVHPDLGPVGFIENEGHGGPTTFYPHDHARYGNRQLEQFIQRSLQDGEPMADGVLPMETLLDEIVNEVETAGFVAEMRTEGQFLIRSYLPPAPDSRCGAYRDAPHIYTRIITRRRQRELLAARLADDPAERLADRAHWQMYNGEDWVPLLGPSPLTSEQAADRIRRAGEVAARDVYNTDVPFGDGLNLFGRPDKEFKLVGDHVDVAKTDQWCRCRSRRSVIPFERWNNGSLEESGTVHAALRCRSLVRLD